METTIPLKDMTFDHYRDDFNRKDIAQNIIKLLDTGIDFCPMAIDGGWGTGKTEFCHKLINLIKEQDAQRQKAAQEAAADAARAAGNAEDAADAAAQPATAREQAAAQTAALPPERAVIYLDAFASETVDDPLLCILAAIRAEFPDKETRKEISRNAVPVVKTLCKVAGKAAFAHVFKQDLGDVSEALADAASDGVNSLIDQTVDKLLDQYADAQENLDALKNVIATAAAQRPILFFIDELDRCRPDFALSILELVKHVFDIPGIKFIFVANLEQLKAAVRKRYGQDVDADVYLEKFVNLSIVLPSIDSKTQKNAACILLEDGLKHTGLFVERYSLYRNFSLHFIEKYNIKLRGIERLIKNINIYTAISGRCPLSVDNAFVDNLAFLFSMFIFTFGKELTHKIAAGNIDNGIFEFAGESQDQELNDFIYLIASIIYYGDDFSVEKLGLEHEKEEEMKRLFKIIIGNRFYYDVFRIKKYFIEYICTMNMIYIN
ncbi:MULTISPECIES: KAP family P-loop NTPase fold protein [Desulfovibrio]|uniref:KAP family P-loop NTPase fold protein n=1 Tax=Desulfovibrio TaxID=872 RepID=UPI0026F02CF3|nr:MULTISPECIES: P-loop NTPase fold protein [Desulfovibrio]MCI7616721.1 KAP family NTPase [Desulfovibrio piger]MDY4807682.1 P-loop NTPase fold protein [Desulfovibrio sp.]